MTRYTTAAVLTAVFACWAGLAPTEVRAQSRAETRARDLAERNASTIGTFMHPTCTYNSMSLTDTKAFGSGAFRLTYRVYFTSAFGNAGWSEVNFMCTAAGSVDYITGGATTFLVSPFTASGIVVNKAKGYLKEHPPIKDNETLLRLVEKSDAQGLLAMIMNFGL